MLNKTAQKQQSFQYATLILGISTILVKIMGAVFKIPLTHLIGEVGMGYFSTAYDVYLPIYALAMAGFPVAVSRIVASYIQQGRYKDARQTLKVVKKVFLVTGLVGFVLMFGISYIVVGVTQNKNALPAMFIIAPSILFCCVMSTYRGYYEGTRNMFPTAVSTLIEATCKLFLGYGFAWVVMNYFNIDDELKLSYAAAAAMLGITVGTVLGAIFLILRYKLKGDIITNEQYANSPPAVDSMTIFKALIAISIPVALGSLVNNIASLVDVAMVQRQLLSSVNSHPEIFRQLYGEYLPEGIENSGIPNYLYGCYKGYAYTIFNLIPTITSVVGVSALPVLTMAWTSGKKSEIKANLESMIKIITLIAFPAGIGIMVLSPQIVEFLYGEAAPVTAKLLSVLGAAACFAGMTTPLTNLLQAIGKPGVPVKNIAVGAVIKIVLNYILVGIPEVNILGAPIGTLMCYVYIAFADVFCLVKYSRVVPSLYKTILKPLISGVVCGIAAYFSANLLDNIIGNKLAVIISIIVACVAYIIAIAVLKCLDKEDIKALPKGEKLVKIFAKLHIIR